MMSALKKLAAKINVAPEMPATAPVSPITGKPGAGMEAKPALNAAPAKSLAPLPAITISNEAIAQAAYYRWQRFGGDEATNWRLAEEELRDEAARLGISA